MAIENIPKANDFFRMGLEHIFIGYEGILKFLHAIREFESYDNNLDLDELEDFWENARLSQLVYTGLIHEGFDHILKSKIVKISPFLIIKNDPASFKNKKDFSEFLTHDSSSLPQILNTVSKEPLDQQFIVSFEKWRKVRNKIRHTYDSKLAIQSEEIIKDTLLMMNLIHKKDWFSMRSDYSSSDPIMNLYAATGISGRASSLLEFETLLEILKPADFLKLFKINKKQRFFLCYECVSDDYTEKIPTCYLKGQKLICLVCKTKSKIIKEKCLDPECKCDLLVEEWGRCASCGD